MPARLPLVSAITAAAAATRRPGVRLTQHDVACRRPLSHTAVLRADDSGSGRAGAPVSHYDALGVSAAASHADIKKSFFSLSKTHHPDHHPPTTRSSASARFMRISEAWAVLGSPDKRAAYDRDVLRLQPLAHRQSPHAAAAARSASAGGSAAARRGSYHSPGGGANRAAGGRPASGLSRRRGSFQGPPPSFFRAAGGGGASRPSEGAGGTAAGDENAGAAGGQGSSGEGTFGGMGPGQDPFGHAGAVPHFDGAGHTRTQRRVYDERAAMRAASGGGSSPRGGDGGRGVGGGLQVDHDPAGGLARFLVVGGILVIGILLPAVVIGGWWSGSGGGTGTARRCGAASASVKAEMEKWVTPSPGPRERRAQRDKEGKG